MLACFRRHTLKSHLINPSYHLSHTQKCVNPQNMEFQLLVGLQMHQKMNPRCIHRTPVEPVVRDSNPFHCLSPLMTVTCSKSSSSWCIARTGTNRSSQVNRLEPSSTSGMSSCSKINVCYVILIEAESMIRPTPQVSDQAACPVLLVQRCAFRLDS